MVVDWVEADANFEAKFNKKAGFKQTNHLDLKHCVLCKLRTQQIYFQVLLSICIVDNLYQLIMRYFCFLMLKKDWIFQA